VLDELSVIDWYQWRFPTAGALGKRVHRGECAGRADSPRHGPAWFL